MVTELRGVQCGVGETPLGWGVQRPCDAMLLSPCTCPLPDVVLEANEVKLALLLLLLLIVAGVLDPNCIPQSQCL